MTADPTHSDRRYRVVDLKSLEAVPCPCGTARRAFVDEPERVASIHLVEVDDQATAHHHRQTTEIYYILEGHGQIELDGVRVDVQPGTAILIKPNCRHRLLGRFRILNIPVPAFDPADEWIERPD